MNEIWIKDFVADNLFEGRKLRMLTVVDLYTRECFAIDAGPELEVIPAWNALRPPKSILPTSRR
jgi:hypothetical protein